MDEQKLQNYSDKLKAYFKRMIAKDENFKDEQTVVQAYLKDINNDFADNKLDADEWFECISECRLHSMHGMNGTSFGTLEIPEGITNIPDNAFKEMRFDYVKIPASVKFIGEHAFSDSYLEKVEFAEGSQLLDMGKYAFADNEKLFQINLPDSLAGIPSYAFENCRSLSDIDIPGSVIYVGIDAFSGCSQLDHADLSNVQTVDRGAFRDCCKLSDVAFPEGPWRCYGQAFIGCAELSSADLGQVDLRGENIFFDCDGLRHVDLSDMQGDAIPVNTFKNCAHLDTVDWPVWPDGEYDDYDKIKIYEGAFGSTYDGPYRARLWKTKPVPNYCIIDDNAFDYTEVGEHGSELFINHPEIMQAWSQATGNDMPAMGENDRKAVTANNAYTMLNPAMPNKIDGIDLQTEFNGSEYLA